MISHDASMIAEQIERLNKNVQYLIEVIQSALEDTSCRKPFQDKFYKKIIRNTNHKEEIKND